MKSKKNVLIVTPYFYPAWSYGGIPRVMFDLAKQFVLDGYNVECVTTDVLDNDSRYDKETEEVDGIKIHYFKNLSNKLVVNFKFPIPFSFNKWLKENISRFDVVHISDFRNLCSYYAYRNCKRFDIPFIVSPFGTVPYTHDYKDIIKKIFDRVWSRNMLLSAKYITVQTNDELLEVNDFGISKEKIELIPLMIEYGNFSTLPSKGYIRKKYNFSDNTKILLFVGRINKHKSTDLMIETFYEYNKKYDNSILIVVGRDDGYEHTLKELSKKLGIDNKVIFPGAIYYPENMNYYVDSDIYFMAPSHYEQTSTASLEALACGTPVVVTKQADIPFIKEYNAGEVVNFDKNVILNSLIEITENELSSDNCIQLIKDHYDVKVIKDRFLDIYFR